MGCLKNHAVLKIHFQKNWAAVSPALLMGEKAMMGVLVLHPLLLWVPVRMTQRIIQLLVALKGDVFTGMLISRQHSAFSSRIAEQVLQPGLQGTCVSSWERIKAQQV